MSEVEIWDVFAQASNNNCAQFQSAQNDSSEQTKQNKTAQKCFMSSSIQQSLIFRAGNGIMIPLDAVGLVMNIVLILVLTRMKGRHLNVRILLANIGLCCCVTSLCHIIKAWRVFAANIPLSALQLATSVVFRNGCTSDETFLTKQLCPLLTNGLLCKLHELPEMTSSGALAIGISIIAAERYIATKHHASYEARSALIGIAMAIATWLLSLSLNCADFFNVNAIPTPLPHCLGVFAVIRKNLTVYLIVILTTTIAVIPIYKVLIRINRKKLDAFWRKQAQLSLSSCMQLRHNIELAEVLLPTVVSHSVLWLIIESLYLLTNFGKTIITDESERIVWSVWIDILISFQSIVYPLIIFVKHKPVTIKLVITTTWLFGKMNKQMDSRTIKFRATRTRELETEQTTDEGRTYMEHLKQAWGEVPAVQIS